MAPDALAQVLRPLESLFPAERYPQLLVGLGACADDAAVYRVSEELALIATVDLITPVVDDPRTFGAIAAANSLSDIFAMGGRAALALNVSCLSECLPPEIVGEILVGGAEKVVEAGAVLAGGHSVDDHEPKYGLVALGFVHPDKVLTKAGARPGDVLVLTKPLGVGIVTTAFKADQTEPEHIDDAVASMLKLNRAASELFQRVGVHACTDVTGFALAGHACEMAEHGGVSLRFHAGRIPFLGGAEIYSDQWLFPSGTGRNLQAYRDRVRFDGGVIEETQQLLHTPETSGGLLAAVSVERLDDLEAVFRDAGEPLWVVGGVRERAKGVLVEVVP